MNKVANNIKIVQKEDAVLRQIATDVPIGEINSQKIQDIIAEMKRAVHSQKDGIAIAAPQIGQSLRIFVINGELLHKADARSKKDDADMVFINPTLQKLSKDKKDMEEGCLSVRWLYGKVRRSSKATINAYDEHGKKIVRGASGLLAQIFQHECDHLDGTLFIDKAKELWEMSEEEIAEMEKANQGHE